MTTHDVAPRTVVAEHQFYDRNDVNTLIFVYNDGICAEIQPVAEKGLVAFTSYTPEGVASAPHKITDTFYRDRLLSGLASQMNVYVERAG